MTGPVSYGDGHLLRPWDLNIVLERGAKVAAWQQIANAVIEAIRRGRLAPGSALPGTRELAARVGVNRKTVQQSYDELIAQGWLTTEPTRGTFVSAMLPSASVSFLGPDSLPAAAMPRDAAFALRGAAPALEAPPALPGVVRFDDGAPDTRLIPAEIVARAWRRALLEGSRRNQLGYGDPRGLFSLREAVAAMLQADRGLECSAENICITRGSQMAIYLAARLLAAPGDEVVFEALSYPPAREAFAAAGARIVSIGLDESGVLPEELERACASGAVRAIYTTPHHQFPTTVVLPQQRRIQLLGLAEQYGFAIVEDDYDHEFHFAHRPMLPLASAHGWSRLIYIGSLSKLLSPSLRIGFMVAAPEVIARAAAEIMMIDRQGDPVTEAAMAELMISGALKSHTRKVLRIYAARRECLAAALRDELGDTVSFTLPPGGLALWVTFAAGIDVAALAQSALDFGVGITPGQNNGARLGFASLNEVELKEAVRRLKEAVLFVNKKNQKNFINLERVRLPPNAHTLD